MKDSETISQREHLTKVIYLHKKATELINENTYLMQLLLKVKFQYPAVFDECITKEDLKKLKIVKV